MRKAGGIRMAGIVIGAALVAMGFLLAVVLSTIRGGTRNAIVLPDPTTQVGTEEPTGPATTQFVTVERENVQAVLSTMSRPVAYHQTMSMERLWDGGSSAGSAEIWRCGDLSLSRINEGSQDRYLLSDGTRLWVWYEGDRAARELLVDASLPFDDLAGIPTYDTVASLDASEILEAGFVALEGSNCLYVSVRREGGEDRYWVDASTQLLCRADVLEGDRQTYQLRQTGCEVLTEDDETLRSLFQLPDGTVITAAEETPPQPAEP